MKHGVKMHLRGHFFRLSANMAAATYLYLSEHGLRISILMQSWFIGCYITGASIYIRTEAPADKARLWFAHPQ
jgi:hypothetical protein